MSETFYRRMFLIGAIWNILGGALIVVFTNWIFNISNLHPPYPLPYYYSWIALFVTFGIGYYMVYTDMYSNKNLVILGIIGKLAFSAIFIYYFVFPGGIVPMIFLIGVIGDLIFVVLFLMFLNFAKKIP